MIHFLFLSIIFFTLFLPFVTSQESIDSGIIYERNATKGWNHFKISLAKYEFAALFLTQLDATSSNIQLSLDWNKSPQNNPKLHLTTAPYHARIDACEGGTFFFSIHNSADVAPIEFKVSLFKNERIQQCYFDGSADVFFTSGYKVLVPSDYSVYFPDDKVPAVWISPYTFPNSNYKMKWKITKEDDTLSESIEIDDVGEAIISIPESLGTSLEYIFSVQGPIGLEEEKEYLGETFAYFDNDETRLSSFPCSAEEIGVLSSSRVYNYEIDAGRSELKMCGEDFLIKVFTVDVGRIAIFESKNRPLVVVSSVGTELAFNDWWSNFQLFQDPCEPDIAGGCNGGEVHGGFLYEFNLIRDFVRNETERRISQGWSVLFSGHSQGGAIVTLVSLDIANYFNLSPDRIFVVTIGSPRVGDPTFVEAWNEKINQSVRYVTDRNGQSDVVAGLPPKSGQYIHVHEATHLFCDTTSKKRGISVSCHSTSYYLWAMFELEEGIGILPSIPLGSPTDSSNDSADRLKSLSVIILIFYGLVVCGMM